MLRGTHSVQTMPIQTVQHTNQKTNIKQKSAGSHSRDETKPLLNPQIQTFTEAKKHLGITSVTKTTDTPKPKVSQGQTDLQAPDNTTFLTHYKADYGIIFHHAIPLKNGGYAASGSRGDQSNPYGRLSITDGYGQTLHSKQIGGSFNELRNIISLNDDTLVLPTTYYMSGFNENMQTSFLGMDGSELKNMAYGSTGPDKGILVCKTPDDGFLNLGLLDWHVFDSYVLIKADAAGAPLWYKTWETDYPGKFSFNAISCSDSIFLGGSRQDKETVVKLTPEGDDDWIVTGDSGQITSVYETAEHGVLFCSNGGGNFKVGELNATGYLDWEMKTNTTKASYCNAVIQTDDKKTVIAGETNHEVKSGTTWELHEYSLGNGFVEVLNDDRSHAWGGIYTDPSHSRFNSVQATPDNGLLLAGFADLEPGVYHDGVLAKVDYRNNNSDCNGLDPFSLNQNPSWTDFSKGSYTHQTYPLLSGEGTTNIVDWATQDINVKNCTTESVRTFPTGNPSSPPSSPPTNGPTLSTQSPTGKPSNTPSSYPTNRPTISTQSPTRKPSSPPSSPPTNGPTALSTELSTQVERLILSPSNAVVLSGSEPNTVFDTCSSHYHMKLDISSHSWPQYNLQPCFKFPTLPNSEFSSSSLGFFIDGLNRGYGGPIRDMKVSLYQEDPDKILNGVTTWNTMGRTGKTHGTLIQTLTPYENQWLEFDTSNFITPNQEFAVCLEVATPENSGTVKCDSPKLSVNYSDPESEEPTQTPSNGPTPLSTRHPTGQPSGQQNSPTTNGPTSFPSINIFSNSPSSTPSFYPTFVSSFLTTPGQSPSFAPSGLPTLTPTGSGQSACDTMMDCTRDHAGEIALGLVITAGLLYAGKKAIQATRGMCSWFNGSQTQNIAMTGPNTTDNPQPSAPINPNRKYTEVIARPIEDN